MNAPNEQLLPVTLTTFTDKTAKTRQTVELSWGELVKQLQQPNSYPSKATCPCLKLATFGDTPTPNGSYRYNENVTAIHGIELDYDGEQMPIATAAEALRSAGVAAVVYSSPSYTAAKPRWRVLCPTSTALPPEAREGLVASVDAILGHVAAGESYTLSQSYYFGRVNGAEYCCQAVDGLPIDTAIAFGMVPKVERPPRGKAAPVGNWQPLPADFDEVLAMKPCPDHGEQNYGEWMPTVLGCLNSFGPAAVPGLVEWSLDWYRQEYAGKDEATVRRIAKKDIEDRIQREGNGKATWENVREARGLPRADVSGVFPPVPVQQSNPDWPEPQPIPDVVLPAPVFDYNMLPAPFIPWVKDIATRKCWAPDYVAVAVMTVCGSLLGRKVALLPDDKDPTWQSTPNLWGLLIGSPSSAKSPSIEEALRLLKPLIDDAEALFEMQEKSYTRELKFHRAKVKSLESKRTKAFADDDENEARKIHDEIGQLEEAFNLRRPKRRRFYSTDATYESLFSLMVDNPQGLMLYKDEMSNLMAQMMMENFAALRSFLISAWKGTTTATKDRVKDEDAPLPAIEACMSLLGGLQPSLLARFLGGARDGSEGDDGFPQRFGLMVWPDDPPTVPNETPKDMAAEKAAGEVIRRLEQWPTKDEPITYQFDGPTQRQFALWHSKIHSDNRSGVVDPALVTWLGKYPKTICAIALITTLVEGRTVVDAQSWQKAMMWEQFLRGHLVRVMDYSTRRATQHAKNIVRKIRESVPGGDNSILCKEGEMVYLTSRTLTNRQLPGCSVTRDTDDLLEWLEELGYVRFRGAGVIKGVKKLWEVNPKLVK